MRCVCITGSSHGLGRELALEFAKTHEVLLHGRDLTALNQVFQQIPDGKAFMVQGDITDTETLRYIEEEAQARDLEILVNNAGMYSNKPAAETTPEELRRIMEVNFYAPVELTKRVLPIFMKKGRGLIVNINSVAGKQGSAGESAYAASKHALRGFFDSLREEVTQYGIRILDVYLGAMKTQMTATRPNHDLLMDPQEAARVIARNCRFYDSLATNEIYLRRIKR